MCVAPVCVRSYLVCAVILSTDLLEILNGVLAHIDPEKHAVDMHSESPEMSYLRLAEAVHVLGYKASFDE